MKLVNNTNADVSDFNTVFFDCIKNNKELPEELDLFTLEVITVDDEKRGILNWA